MRHRKNKVTLDRNARQRRPLFRNLAISLIMHERMTTTRAKAKAVRPLVERLITHGKKADLTARRYVISALNNSAAAHKVVTVLGPRYAKRAGGYLRFVRLAPRAGDNADQVLVEFV